MKKLSVKEELIKAKYQYPATCKPYNKLGEVVATRTITHNLKATAELREMHPSLKHEINRITEVKPEKPQTVRQMINMLGKEEGEYFRK